LIDAMWDITCLTLMLGRKCQRQKEPFQYQYISLSLHFNGLFPGEHGLAGVY